jgi:glutamyl-Q tRNA(Asp) synthetase
MLSTRPYRGRFAPSPTGPLHAGSLVAALASWLDARAHGGEWLVRIEDIDSPRCVPGAEATIMAQLTALALVPDEPPIRQSGRSRSYQMALSRLLAAGWAYPCGCTRADIAQVWLEAGVDRPKNAELAYPGTCRSGLHGKAARAARLLAAPSLTAPDEPLAIEWHDRRLGAQRQEVSSFVGDVVLRRADGLWAYQLAVVVDDAAQAITDVVRGEDLADNTPRQIHLQRVLGLATPGYLHAPMVLGPDGDKLSKQNGAAPLDTSEPLRALRSAGRVLGIGPTSTEVVPWLAEATGQWRERWRIG